MEYDYEQLQQSRTISEYLENEFQDYAMYLIEDRAIPSVIDGFKPTQRKIAHVAYNTWKNGGNAMKIFQLTGKIAYECNYHHGDASLNKAIIGMAQSFKNNLPLLEEIGQFGTLRSPQAGAPRYISTKLSPNFKLLYKDFELLEQQIEENIKIEPFYFLPIIPTILINGGSGIAYGFSTNILNRNPLKIIKECYRWLENKKVRELPPFLNKFQGYIIKDEKQPNKYYLKGVYQKTSENSISITELPPGFTMENWEDHLEKLKTQRYIVDYDDKSQGNILEYVVKFRKEYLKEKSWDEIENLLKLFEQQTEIYNTLDEKGNLKCFNNVREIINYFMNFRLNYFEKRKEYLINKIEQELILRNNKANFLKKIIEGNLFVNNRRKKDIEKDLKELKFDKINDSYNYLLDISIHSLTKEKYQEIKNDIEEKQKSLKEIKEKDISEMFKEDLLDLEQKIKNNYDRK